MEFGLYTKAAVLGYGVGDGEVPFPPYSVEGKLRLTRGILEAILTSGVQPRLTVQTRSPLVTRDVDLLRQFERVRVNVTVTTDSEKVRRRYEPHCPSIAVRFKTLARLTDAGVKIGVSVSPMLPLSDAEDFGERLAELAADEYVTQYLKPGRSRFGAGTDVEAARKAREDGWGLRQYREAREVLARRLGSRKLLEGAEGYAPP